MARNSSQISWKFWRYVNQDAIPWILRYNKPIFGETIFFRNFPKFINLLISWKSRISQKFWLYDIKDEIPWILRYLYISLCLKKIYFWEKLPKISVFEIFANILASHYFGCISLHTCRFLGKYLFSLQRFGGRTDGQTDGWTHRAKTYMPPTCWAEA